jgi:hypothetical protein
MDADEMVADLLGNAGDRLLRLAFQLSHDRAAAEDLVQQALEQVYRRWRRHGTDVEHAEAYARRAVVNEYLRRRRLRSAPELITDVVPETASAAPDAAVAERERCGAFSVSCPPGSERRWCCGITRNCPTVISPPYSAAGRRRCAALSPEACTPCAHPPWSPLGR